jgi:hypothetical protein
MLLSELKKRGEADYGITTPRTRRNLEADPRQPG